MKRRLGIVVVTTLTCALLTTGAGAHEGSHSVEIRDMAFHPKALQIDPGETVTWTALEDGHNVVSDSGAWSPSATLRKDQTFAVPFPEEGTFGYTCTVHNMVGTIKVGDGCLGDCPVPDPEAPPEVRIVPSLEWPNLSGALAGAPADTIVEVRPGTYEVTDTIELSTPGVVLRGVNEDGTTASPESVVLRGRRGTHVGIRFGPSSAATTLKPATVENLTVTGFLDTGVLAEQARGFRISNVRAVQNVEYGIRTLRSTSGVILDSVVSGHRRAGVSIESCESCDVRVRRLTSENNFVGIQGRNAGSLVVQDSVVARNAAGIVLRSVATEEPRLQRGSHLYRNTVSDNVNAEAPRPPLLALDEALELGSGAGIWIQGGWDDAVENNVVTGNHYGIVITASTAPTKDATILRNKVFGNAVDLGIDGLGSGNCFSGNNPTTTEPAELETLYACGRPGEAGLPYPKVTGDLALYAWRTYYCSEVDPRGCI